jgi:hypothetical protein
VLFRSGTSSQGRFQTQRPPRALRPSSESGSRRLPSTTSGRASGPNASPRFSMRLVEKVSGDPSASLARRARALPAASAGGLGWRKAPWVRSSASAFARRRVRRPYKAGAASAVSVPVSWFSQGRDRVTARSPGSAIPRWVGYLLTTRGVRIQEVGVNPQRRAVVEWVSQQFDSVSARPLGSENPAGYPLRRVVAHRVRQLAAVLKNGEVWNAPGCARGRFSCRNRWTVFGSQAPANSRSGAGLACDSRT